MMKKKVMNIEIPGIESDKDADLIQYVSFVA